MQSVLCRTATFTVARLLNLKELLIDHRPLLTRREVLVEGLGHEVDLRASLSHGGISLPPYAGCSLKIRVVDQLIQHEVGYIGARNTHGPDEAADVTPVTIGSAFQSVS